MRQYKINKIKTSEKIKDLIHASSFTIEQLADNLGFTSPRVIYEWMNGNKLPSLETLISISKLFDLRVEEILVIEPTVHCDDNY